MAECSGHCFTLSRDCRGEAACGAPGAHGSRRQRVLLAPSCDELPMHADDRLKREPSMHHYPADGVHPGRGTSTAGSWGLLLLRRAAVRRISAIQRGIEMMMATTNSIGGSADSPRHAAEGALRPCSGVSLTVLERTFEILSRNTVRKAQIAANPCYRVTEDS